ncbi:hypothetical protein NA56DRAFT_734260 [Hyaloscypha hepaticicola]|uniref:Uncharacterized protein n=1 Tax=Hyaloscypha hepaticicola TaxID=2082293 RepID=A0A2J6PM44_9HELO|nr:hypothetical protein NA56DRAFT_734260 [Hyaloscypha hepaticicola]
MTGFPKLIKGLSDKAGSGKSMLMKFIYGNPITTRHLERWASPHTLVTAAFYFWNSGSKMQMSKQGLLQTLLFKTLRQQPSLIPKVFPEQWEVFSLFSDDPRDLSWLNLVKGITRLGEENCPTMRFCFFIDGLDELDGDHSDLIELLQELGKTTGVKICVSSRPWTVFEDAFNTMPSLMLQDLTYPDFQLFVEEKFRNNARFIELEQREPEYSSLLMEEIVQKASGIFLWVHLVVRSLLEGLTNGDRISDLQRRLDLLPPGLEDLFQKMLESIDPFYLEHASQLFQIIRVALVPPTLLYFSLADEENPDYVFRAPVRPMIEVEMLFRSKNMRRRLNSRCKGFIEVAPSPESQRSDRNPGDQMCSRKVQYLHRTVKDFLETPEAIDRIIAAADPCFNPYRSLCTSFCQLGSREDGTSVSPPYGSRKP